MFRRQEMISGGEVKTQDLTPCRPHRGNLIRAWVVGAVLLLMGMACVLGAYAQEISAGDAAHFLRDGIGARARGMGGAYTALADDMTASFWNPAPALQTASRTAGGAHEERSGGLFGFDYLGATIVAEGWGAGGIVLTSEMYDMYLLSGGYLGESLSIGLGAKAYVFGIPGQRGTGIGFDAGARCIAEWDGISILLGLVSRDIGWTSIRWTSLDVESVDRAAWVTRVGAAFISDLSVGQGILALDGELAMLRPRRPGEAGYWARAIDANLSLGVELRWEMLRVRGGLQRIDLLSSGGRPRATLGLGVFFASFSVDLAMVPSQLGTTYLGGFQVEF